MSTAFSSSYCTPIGLPPPPPLHTGMLQRCSQAPAATCAVLRYASLQLLLRLLRAGDRVTPHLTTRDLLR